MKRTFKKKERLYPGDIVTRISEDGKPVGETLQVVDVADFIPNPRGARFPNAVAILDDGTREVAWNLLCSVGAEYDTEIEGIKAIKIRMEKHGESLRKVRKTFVQRKTDCCILGVEWFSRKMKGTKKWMLEKISFVGH